jgi:hypothetical protein
MSEPSKGSVILPPSHAECRSSLMANNIYTNVITKLCFSPEGFWAHHQPATSALPGHPPNDF